MDNLCYVGFKVSFILGIMMLVLNGIFDFIYFIIVFVGGL